MQCYKIEITDLAETDLENVGDYTAFDLKSPETAVNMINGLKKEIHKLQHYPARHETEQDSALAEMGIRRHYFKNYKIFYLVDEPEKRVIILRILHMLVDSKAAMYRTLEL